MTPDPFALEFRIRPTDQDLLRGIAAATEGVFQIEPEDVWDLPSPGNLPAVPIWHYFLAAAAVLFVLDAVARRVP